MRRYTKNAKKKVWIFRPIDVFNLGFFRSDDLVIWTVYAVLARENSHFFLDFMVLRQVKLNRCLRPTFFTVNQNIGCRFICVCRGDTRQRAFESPDPGECFTYPHDGCKVSRKFSRDA